MDNYKRAALFQYPDEIPTSVSVLPAGWMKYRGDLAAIAEKYPEYFKDLEKRKQNYDDYGSERNKPGTRVDVWGCVWSNIRAGHDSIVTGHPLPTRESVRTFSPPSVDDGIPHGFMYLRLADLRGFEELMLDFAEEPPELQMLIDMVADYNCEQVKRKLKTFDGWLMHFGDDLGMQTSLPMGPEKWRKYLKPAFAKIYAPVKAAGKYIYMHTDGHIYEIIPDLKECGVDIINPQFRANGIDNLQRVCRGKICVNLDLDRQLFPFASPKDIDDHIHEAVEKMYLPEGGLMLFAEMDDGVPLKTIDCICASLRKWRTYKK